jgi:transcriptional regulator with XRE-family HTH domain
MINCKAGTLETTPEERRRAGLFLKRAREQAGVTQLEIAKAIGIAYSTMISQIEVGKARVPPAHYTEYARALGMNPEDFCRELLKTYDPHMWRILFGPRSGSAGSRGG